MRTSINGALALILVAAAGPSFAQATTAPTTTASTDAEGAAPSAADPPRDFTVSGNVAFVSDYRFRGVSLSNTDIAVQGGITVSHNSGLYAGIWGSSLEDSPTYGHTEFDLIAGYSAEIASGTKIDVGLTYYMYPNGHGPRNYVEPYASLSTTLGPVSAKLGAAYAISSDSLGNNDNIYVYTDWSAGIAQTPVTLVAHAGYSNGSLAYVGHYWDWALGADVALGHHLIAGVRYIDTDINADSGVKAVDKIFNERIMFSLTAAF